MSGARTSPKFEVIASTRRRWGREQKLAILAEVDAPGIDWRAPQHTWRPQIAG